MSDFNFAFFATKSQVFQFLPKTTPKTTPGFVKISSHQIAINSVSDPPNMTPQNASLVNFYTLKSVSLKLFLFLKAFETALSIALRLVKI